MFSPSRGFFYCLPVRLGALVVSLLAFLGSGILAGVTFHSLATISAHITPSQTAGFYLASVSWATLSFFSLLGFIAVIVQHPLILTIFARFILYHLPASLLCNLFFTIVLLDSYRDTDAILRSPQCTQLRPPTAICSAFASLERLTWVYLFIMLPASIAQSYIYVIVQRFIFVVSGEWAFQQEEVLERRRGSAGKLLGRQRRTTITQTIGHGGRRRAKGDLRFTMETPGLAADESFLPSMILSPGDLTGTPGTPFSRGSSAPLLSPFVSPRFGAESSKSLPSLPSSTSESRKGKDGSSERSAKMGMDFSDPDPAAESPRSGEWIKPAMPAQQEPLLRGKGKERQSDTSTYSITSAREVSSGSSSTRI